MIYHEFNVTSHQDYPEEEEMETGVEQTMCVSYVKSPYKKTRRSICKVGALFIMNLTSRVIL